MSAGPRISASRRGEASAISLTSRSPRPTRSAPGGRSAARGRPLGRPRRAAPRPRCEVGGALDLGNDHRVEPLACRRPPRATSSSNQGVEVPLTRTLTVAAAQLPSRERLDDGRPRLLLLLRRHRVLEVDHDLVGRPAPTPSRASGAGEPVRKGRSAGPSSAPSICARLVSIRLKLEEERRRGSGPEGHRGWPLLRGSGAGPGLRRARR